MCVLMQTIEVAITVVPSSSLCTLKHNFVLFAEQDDVHCFGIGKLHVNNNREFCSESLTQSHVTY